MPGVLIDLLYISYTSLLYVCFITISILASSYFHLHQSYKLASFIHYGSMGSENKYKTNKRKFEMAGVESNHLYICCISLLHVCFVTISKSAYSYHIIHVHKPLNRTIQTQFLTPCVGKDSQNRNNRKKNGRLK